VTLRFLGTVALSGTFNKAFTTLAANDSGVCLVQRSCDILDTSFYLLSFLVSERMESFYQHSKVAT
jgi:hypothetical protein